MRKLAAILALVLSGCAHGDSRLIASTLFTAGIIAIEIAASTPPITPMCDDDGGDPPHTCPGTTPGPASAPPPPPDP